MPRPVLLCWAAWSAAYAAAAALNTSVLLGHGDTLAGWTTAWNTPSPGNSLGVSAAGAATPWRGLPYFNLTYDFRSGVTATEWLTLDPALAARVLAAPNATHLCFSALNPSATNRTAVTVTVTDSAARVHGTSVTVPPGGWHNFTLALGPAGPWWPANATWPLPLQALALGPSRAPPFAADAGMLGLADLFLLVDAPPAAVPSPLTWLLLQPGAATGGVLVAGAPDDGGAPARLGAHIVNRLPTPCAVDAVVEVRNATGPMGEGAGGSMEASWQPCAVLRSSGSGSAALAPWESREMACAVSSLGAPGGYLVMRARLVNSSCWQLPGDPWQQLQQVEGALALALPQAPFAPTPPRNQAPGVFGGQMMLPSPLAAARLGMRSIRTTAAIWRYTQRAECWDNGGNASTSCFAWDKADAEVAGLVAAGMELMLDVLEMAPAWAAARNDSGPTWAFIPGQQHYDDFQRFVGLVIDRYGAAATAVEALNEADGLAYFQPEGVPLNGTAIPLAIDLTMRIAAAVAASPNGTHLELFGLPTSGFDIKQQWPGGPIYGFFERAVLSAPGMMRALAGAAPHPYADTVWVPYATADGRNSSFSFFNETPSDGGSYNSSAQQLYTVAELMREAAGAAGLPPGYSPRLRPSEFGYALAIPSSATEGWAVMHAALVAQALLHLRSAPLAPRVEKAFLFAADDGCCEEQNSFYGLWRPAQLRTGPSALQPYTQPVHLGATMPLPAAAAYAAAAALVDVPSGRAAGVPVVDNSGAAPGAYAPSCFAFEGSSETRPLVALFVTAHHYNDRVAASLVVAAGSLAQTALLNGLGAPMAPLAAAPLSGGRLNVTLAVASLPQYLILPLGASSLDACASLVW